MFQLSGSFCTRKPQGYAVLIDTWHLRVVRCVPKAHAQHGWQVFLDPNMIVTIAMAVSHKLSIVPACKTSRIYTNCVTQICQPCSFVLVQHEADAKLALQRECEKRAYWPLCVCV